jgi:hypothetical protein
VRHIDPSAVGAGLDEISQFLRETTRELRVGLGSCAVLVPTRQIGQTLMMGLADRGIATKFMEKQNIDLNLPAVKVMTRHSAKGLEFPIVVVADHAMADFYPAPDSKSEEDLAESQRAERRLLYVAMTRAMDRLLVVAPAQHPLLGPTAFAPEYWQIGGVSQVAATSGSAL